MTDHPAPDSAAPLSPKQFRAHRDELIARPGWHGQARRQALTALTDEWLTDLFVAGGGDKAGAALVAVGGHGRRDLAPGSDLDLLLLHTGDAETVAEAIWYPIWDSGIALDHSVRTVPQARRMAAEDIKVVLGVLDARTIAGDDSLRQDLVSSVLSDWRGLAKRRLPELLEMVEMRRDREGELAYLLEPDLKESYGGLRDVTILRAITASWLSDIEHTRITTAARTLMDARDALHCELLANRNGRPGDRLLLQELPGVSGRLGFEDSRDFSREVSAAGRTIAYASDDTWYRVRRLTSRVRGGPLRRLASGRKVEKRRPLADGVVEQAGEVVLAESARPDRDPTMALRAAAAAAQAGLPLSPHALRRLANESAPMPVPWPGEARDALAALLGAGRPAIAVWEGLDQVGIIEQLIPQWAPVRSAPQRNPVHRFTVDRHLVEAAIQAGRLQREVHRPDLLIVAGLLHDIGKGRPERDHSDLGAELVAGIAPHIGFDEADTETLVRLTRHHLLLSEVATRRDLEDPATIEAVAETVQDEKTLELLYALTRADAAATGPAVWTDWKASLVAELVERVRRVLRGKPMAKPRPLPIAHQELLQVDGLAVLVEQLTTGLQISVAADDRRGLLALIAGTLSLHRLDVRGARTTTVGKRALTVWSVVPSFGEPPAQERLRSDLTMALNGSLDIAGKIRRREEAYPAPLGVDPPPARVDVISEASRSATVIEVRAHDRPGTLYHLSRALAAAGVDIQSALVESRGASVVDTFYVTGPDGAPLGPSGVAAVENALLEVVRR